LESLDAEPDMPLKFQQSMLEMALADSERLRKLIQDFLLLSRLENNLITWQVEPINFSDWVAQAVSHFQVASHHRDLPIIIMNVPSTLPLVIADGEALFQILNKLLDNACKFTSTTGKITIKVKDKKILANRKQAQHQRMLEIQIMDTGCGIEPHQLKTIFERFHQEENFLQRTVGGAGLGLAICQLLVQQLGGQIWATSKGKGKGSQLYITLPIMLEGSCTCIQPLDTPQVYSEAVLEFCD
jgi:signal transduction histidine kinase